MRACAASLRSVVQRCQRTLDPGAALAHQRQLHPQRHRGDGQRNTERRVADPLEKAQFSAARRLSMCRRIGGNPLADGGAFRTRLRPPTKQIAVILGRGGATQSPNAATLLRASPGRTAAWCLSSAIMFGAEFVDDRTTKERLRRPDWRSATACEKSCPPTTASAAVRRKVADEHRQDAGAARARSAGKQLIAPVERCAERLVPRQRRAPPRLQQAGTGRRAARPVRGTANAAGAAGRQLDRQRDAVQPAANLRNNRRIGIVQFEAVEMLRRRAFDEQLDAGERSRPPPPSGRRRAPGCPAAECRCTRSPAARSGSRLVARMCTPGAADEHVFGNCARPPRSRARNCRTPAASGGLSDARAGPAPNCRLTPTSPTPWRTRSAARRGR